MISSRLLARALYRGVHESADINAYVEKTISFLKENNLLHLAPQVLRHLERERHEEDIKKTLFVTTSHDFGEKILEQIKEMTPKAKGEKWKVSVDSSLIAGFVVRGPTTIFDASLAKNLEYLEESLVNS